MTRSPRRSTFAIAMLCSLGLIAAACGDDDDEPSTTDSSEETTTSAAAGTTAAPASGEPTTTAAAATDTTTGEAIGEPTGTPITIGVVFGETGRTAANYGSAGAVAEAWAEWVNTEQGGVNGHPVTIVKGDNQADPAIAQSAAQQLVEGDGAVALVVQDTISEPALIEYTTQQQVPVIGGSANSYNPTWPSHYFNIATSNPASSAATMIVAKAVGAQNFGAAVCAEVPVCADADGLYESLKDAIGINYVGLVTVGAADPSYTAPCLQLIDSGADSIQLGIGGPTIQAVIEECRIQGYDGYFNSGMNSITAATFDPLLDGLKFAGALNGFPWWADDPQVEEFRTAMETFAPDTDIRNPTATTTWAALELFRKAMTESGPGADEEVTAADVLEVYYGIEGETLGGLLPMPITFSADAAPQTVVNCFFPFEIVDGEYQSLDTGGESGNGVDGDLKSTCWNG